MFGLAVLFFLAIFVLIAVGAMWAGARIGKGFGELVHMPVAGTIVGLFCGFMMPTGFLFLSWAQEMIAAERMVSELCSTKAGNRIVLSPEEHARRIRDDDWEGVRRAVVKDRTNGPYVIGKTVTIEGQEFWMSNNEAEGKNGAVIQMRVPSVIKYPRFIWHTHYVLYDVEHRVPLYYTEGFQVNKYGDLGLRFWLNERHGCYYSIVERGYDTLLAQYRHNFERGEQE